MAQDEKETIYNHGARLAAIEKDVGNLREMMKEHASQSAQHMERVERKLDEAIQAKSETDNQLILHDQRIGNVEERAGSLSKRLWGLLVALLTTIIIAVGSFFRVVPK